MIINALKCIRNALCIYVYCLFIVDGCRCREMTRVSKFCPANVAQYHVKPNVRWIIFSSIWCPFVFSINIILFKTFEYTNKQLYKYLSNHQIQFLYSKAHSKINAGMKYMHGTKLKHKHQRSATRATLDCSHLEVSRQKRKRERERGES